MDKKTQYSSIHKILYVADDVFDSVKTEITFSNLETCIGEKLVRFCGTNMNNESLKSKIVETLEGLKIMCNKMTHKEIRSILLGLMNDIDRGG